jgi:hypothetical protein
MAEKIGRVPNIDSTTRELPPEKIIRGFFTLSAREEAALSKHIKASDGMVQVFIHPDFESYGEFEDRSERLTNPTQLKWAEQTFRNIISSKSGDVAPVFIFVTAENNKEFQQKESRLAAISKQPLYIIRTELGDPHPLSPSRAANYSFSSDKINDQERSEVWDNLISKLRKLGIKKILIGGSKLYISKIPDQKHMGCLGEAMGKLKNDFDLKLSTITWPEGRKELRDNKI